MNERDHLYLPDTLDAAREPISFVYGPDSDTLETDRKLALALVQEIATVGRSGGKVSPEVVRSSPGVPRPKIIGMRNRLILRTVRWISKWSGRPLRRIYRLS
jgi:uncharacterized protein with HEPN domain